VRRSLTPEASGELRPSSRPTASFGRASDLPKEFFEPALEHAESSLAPTLDPGPRRSRTRLSIFLFVTLFAAVAALLGLAVKKKLEVSERPGPTLGSVFRVR
jgi:hypothetical protein